ncbi:VasL domain-containing protein [Buttiauxella ferragutiae]|uniref:VasL domain-containing protein n=1 Tax=Buttiauxella ferragutiae TaxID=82989 RepID=UPI0035231294
MTASYQHSFSPEKLKVNCHDPRCHQTFLQLSHDMQRWKLHASDRSWWLEREKQCSELFRQYGYDLQNGVWYCLIACQRNGWKGVTSASQMLAEGFIRQKKACWPPQAARELRTQILEWYCTQLLPLIYALPLTAVSSATLQPLLNTVKQLHSHAGELHTPQSIALQQMSAWLASNIRTLEEPVRSPAATGSVVPAALPPEFSLPPVSGSTPGVRWLWGGVGAILTVLIFATSSAIKNPVFMTYSNHLWPENPLYVQWRQRLERESATLPVNDTYQQLNQQLDILEKRLLEAEQNRKSYMTISELKTAVYQLHETLQQQQTLFEHQLNLLQAQVKENRPVSPDTLYSLSSKLDALNSRFLLLRDTIPVDTGLPHKRSSSTSDVGPP